MYWETFVLLLVICSGSINSNCVYTDYKVGGNLCQNCCDLFKLTSYDMIRS